MSQTTEGLHIPEWTLADRLNKTLRDAGLGTASMAEYLEVHRNTVINWVQGRTKPPASAVKLWSMRVGVPYEWLAHGLETHPLASSNALPSGRATQPPSTADIKAIRRRIPLRAPRIEPLLRLVAA